MVKKAVPMRKKNVRIKWSATANGYHKQEKYIPGW